MSAQKLLFLVSHAAAGGAQEIMGNLAEGFRAEGADVRLMALYPSSRPIRGTVIPWEFLAPAKPRSPLGMVKLGRTMLAWLDKERPDWIFSALPAANVVAAFGAAASTNGRTKVVITHHSPVSTHNRALNLLDSLAGTLGSVQAIVSVSDAVSASLDGKPALYRAKRRTIHNALPPRIEQLLQTLAESETPRVVRARRVVATGRLAEQKNYPTLIRAAAVMPDVRIDIVGSGPDEADLRRLAARLGVDDRVTLFGQRPREEALSLLAAGDVFVQVSLFEGHSLALLEAAKLGLPLVVSDVATQVEAITAATGESCGIVVPARDHVALAAAVTRLLDDPDEYARYAALSRRLAAKITYRATMDAYGRLAA